MAMGDRQVKTDIQRIKRILDGKRVEYEEVDLSARPQRKEEMMAASNQVRTLPQLHIDGKVSSEVAWPGRSDFGYAGCCVLQNIVLFNKLPLLS